MSTLDKPARRPQNPNFSCGPCAKRPGWTPEALRFRAARPLAPFAGGPRPPQARHRQDACAAGAAARLSRRHRAGLRHRRLRDGAVVDARRARRRRAGVGGFRQALGRRHRRRAEARRIRACWKRTTDGCPTWAPSISTAMSSSPGTARPPACACRTAMDRRRPPRAHLRRRHIGIVCAGGRLGENRCRHLLVAEGARRRGRARHDRAVAARGRAPRELRPSGRCRSCSALPRTAACSRACSRA